MATIRPPRSADSRTRTRGSEVRVHLDEGGIVPFSEDLAAAAAEVFRKLGSPRKRGADIAIGVTASTLGAVLMTRNKRDFAGIPGLEIEVVSG